MYIVFQNTPESPFQHPIEAIMGMFMMSLGEFGDYYENFDQTDHPVLSKVNPVLCNCFSVPLIAVILICFMSYVFSV